MTGREHKRLVECYRLALMSGDVARHRKMFRYGKVVRFRIDDEKGFSDGIRPEPTTGLRDVLIGQFQLRHSDPPLPSAHYGVWGRIEGQTEWVPVDGPWRCGEGPFDNRPKKSPWVP